MITQMIILISIFWGFIGFFNWLIVLYWDDWWMEYYTEEEKYFGITLFIHLIYSILEGPVGVYNSCKHYLN